MRLGSRRAHGDALKGTMGIAMMRQRLGGQVQSLAAQGPSITRSSCKLSFVFRLVVRLEASPTPQAGPFSQVPLR